MIANDDAPENQVKPSAAMSASSGNAQVMIEEDPAASSVQYCCDGCSTVPILRQRWHCNICPDFDLCETCYEILDADRLPAPHSKDHPMSAIPIELDTFGGEGNEIHFSIDELTEVFRPPHHQFMFLIQVSPQTSLRLLQTKQLFRFLHQNVPLTPCCLAI
jgi:E3 ubiquitin-protein ligase UBR4